MHCIVIFPSLHDKHPMTGKTTKLPRRNRTGVATRARIIEAAIAVLAEKGFSGFTLQAVADRAEVLFGSVTHHYGTRERLIEAMLEAILTRYRDRFGDLTEALREDESPVHALVTWLLDDAVEPDTAGLFLELWAMASHLPIVAEGVNQLYDDAVDACIVALGLPPARATSNASANRCMCSGPWSRERRRSSAIAAATGRCGAA